MSISDRILDSGLVGVAVGCVLGGLAFGLWEWKLPLHQNGLFESILAVSASVGVIAGFLGAGLLFLATVSNPLMKRIRRKYGTQLHHTVLSAVALSMAFAVGLPAAGLFIAGWGARLAVCLMLGVLTVSFARALLVISGILATTVKDAEAAD